MFLHVGHVRRKVFFVVGAIVAGGYVSYYVYSSEYLSRKRKQISGLVQGFSTLCESFKDGADSAALVCRDFKAFLLSEENGIPQSLKQAFKIMHSQEFEFAIATLSQGVIRGISERRHTWKEEEDAGILNGRRELVTDRAICVHHGYTISTEDSDRGNAFHRKYGCSFSECLGNRKGSQYETHNGVKTFGCCGESHEDLLERLMEKLFSERGTSFVSMLVGSAARNFTSSILEIMRTSNTVEEKNVDLGTLEERKSDKYLPMQNPKISPTVEKIINFASDRKLRTLIAECIEVFVATAVSVYLDKTKEINVYDDLVAGLTKPSHQAPVKDLLKFICSGAVDTLVRTSHEVLSQHGRSDHQKQEQAMSSEKKNILEADIGGMDAKKGIPIRRCLSAELAYKQRDDSSEESLTVLRADIDHFLDSHKASASLSPISYNSDLCKRKDAKEVFLSQLQKSRSDTSRQQEAGSLSFIDGLSKALAVPNIRKLVIEVAGAIVFQAVRSLFDVILAFFKPVHEGHDGEQRHEGVSSFLTIPRPKIDKVMHIARVIAANRLVAATLWLAIIMHVMSGVMEGN